MIYLKVKRLKRSLFILLVLVLFVERANAQVQVHPDSCSRNILEFDGTDDFVSVSIPGFSYAQGTIEAWVRKDNWQDAVDDALFSNGIRHSDPNSFFVSFHPVVGLHFRYGGNEAGAVYAGSNPLSPPISTANLTPGSWHHVAVVWNNFNGQTRLTAYLDEVNVASAITSTNLVLAGGTDFLIGGGVSGSHTVLQSGTIAELKVWSIAKTATAISQDKNSILSGTEPGLIAYLPMNNAVGTSTVKDLVSGNNATLNNMTVPNTSVFKPLEVAVAGTKIEDQGLYDFGVVGGSSGDVTFTVTNTRPATIDLSNARFVTWSGANIDNFSLDLDDMATSLAAGASTTFSVRFNPSSLGESEAQLNISHLIGCSNPYVINLKGRTPNPDIAYSGGFSEGASNDGSVTGSLTITLRGDTFQDLDADGKLDVGSEVTVNNIPAGLIANIAITSPTVAVLTLTGKANNELHQNSKDVSDITFSFDDSAFTSSTADQVANATGPASSGVGIDFQDNTAVIAYAGAGFEETSLNNGKVSGDISVILSGDTFQDNDADGLLDIGSEVNINNIPAGLTPKLSIMHNTLPGKIWTAHAVELHQWNSVAYGNGRFVAVASSGFRNVMTSTDGINWTPVDMLVYGNWYSITYGNGLFVAIADSGTNRVMTSPDGINWTIRAAPQGNSWASVTYGNGLYVAVARAGDNDRIMTSPDGVNWTVRAAPEAYSWNSVTYGNGLFVAVAAGTSGVMTSPDGINWTIRSVPQAYLVAVTYGGGLFVAVGNTTVLTSPDGINWSSHPISNSSVLVSISYGGGLFVAVADGTNKVLTSSNGINWSESFRAEANSLNSVTYGNGLFVAVSKSGTNRVESSGALATLSLEGKATAHASAQDVANITFSFDNSAFDLTPVVNVTNAAGTASSGLGINFNDNNGLITYSGSGFTEAVANEGAVSGSIAIELTGGETFKDTDSDNLIDFGTEYNLVGLPAGLVPQLTMNSPTQAVLSLSGNAYLHQNENDLSDLQLVFKNEAFTGGSAAAVGNAIGPASTGLGIDFSDNTVALSYVGGGFNELIMNDGAVNGSITITLTGDTFQDTNTNNQLEVGAEVALSNIPAGLNPVFTLISNTQVRLTLEGKAIDHQHAQSVNDMAITFTDQAFSATSAKAVANANAFKLPGKIEFEDNRAAIAYSGAGFTEAVANNGAVTGAVNVALSGEHFQDADTDNLIDMGTEVEIINVPSGLSPVLTIDSNQPIGKNWTVHPVIEGVNWNSVAYGNNLFVAVGDSDNRRLATSPDGVNWTFRDIVHAGWTTVAYGNGLFVAFSQYNFITSPDGINWTLHDVPSNGIQAITYSNGLFVAVGSQGLVMTSPDGINWTPQTTPVSKTWNSVIYGNGLYVATTFNSFTGADAIITSPDGINWTLRQSQGAKRLGGIAYGNGLFVIVTARGASTTSAADRILTSSNGIDWTLRNAPEANAWSSVTYGQGHFIAVASSGTNQVMTSPDGINWTAHAAAAVESWKRVLYANGRAIAMSNNRVMISEASASATLTLTGQADKHQDAQDANDITFAFKDNAFGTFAAAGIDKATGPASSQKGIDFQDNGTAPVITAISNQSVRALETLSLSVTANDSDVPSQTLTYRLNQAALDLGMSIDANTGAFSWTPTTAQIGNTYTVEVEVADEFLSAKETFDIQVLKANQTITFNALSAGTYGDASFDLNATTSAGTTVTYTSSNTNVATVSGNTVTIVGVGTTNILANQSGNANFNPATEVVQSLTVAPRPITVTAGAKSKTYGHADPALTYQLTSGSLVGADAISGSLSRIAGENAGTYTINQNTLTAGANYNLTYVPANLTIGTKSLTITAEAKSKIYGDADPSFTYQITLGDLVGSDAITGSLSRAAGENVGAFTINQNTLSAGANYNLTYVPANLTITRAALTVTADNKSKTYGEANPPLTISYSGFVNGGDASAITEPTISTTANATTGVGTYEITLSGGSATNYTLTTVNGTLTIGTKALTITAEAKSKVYGEADPALTYQLTSGSLVGADAISGSLSRVSGENAGTYTINQNTLTVGANYNLTYVPANLTIGTKSLTITAGAKSKTYGDADPALTYQITSGSLVGADAISGSLSRIAGENAGTYTINQNTLTAGANYNLTYVPANLTIGTKSLTITAEAKSKTYGDADPALTYQVTNGSLVGSDAITGSLSRASGENVGAFTINQNTLSAGANYNLTYVPANLTITRAALTVTVDNKSKTYGEANPPLTISYSGFVNGDDASAITEPTISTTANATTGVGTYEITLSGGSATNYTLTTVNGTLTIGTKALTITADAKSKTYGDADPALTYQLTSGSLVGADAISGSLSRIAGENAGTYTINQNTLTVGANYNLTYVPANLTIGTKSLTITARAKSKTYGDADPALTYQITSGALVGSDAITGTLTRTSGENVGTYAINQNTLTAGANYNLIYVPANLTISTRALTITAEAKSKTYGDADPSFTYQITSGDLVGSDAITGALARASGENAGTYAINQNTLTAGANYNLIYVPANLTISTRALTITAEAKSKTYGDADPALTYQLTSGSLVGADAISGSLSRIAGENAGTYTINQNTLTVGANYNLTYVPANLTIGTKSLTITARAKSKTYGDADPALTYQITSGALVGSDAITGTLTRTSGENVGTYAINQNTLTAGANYNLIYVPANLTISTRALTITAEAKSKTYGDADPALTYQVTLGSLVGSDAITGSLSRVSGENAGTYTINQNTLSAGANYHVTYVSNDLTINKAVLTVTADDKHKIYGATNPNLTISYSGFVGGDDVSSITIPIAGTAADAGSDVGSYTITLSGGSATNYILTLVDGILTVDKATLIATADNQTRLKGVANPELTISYSGFVNRDDASMLDTPPTASTTADINSERGEYPISLSEGMDNNYLFTLEDGTLTVVAPVVELPALVSFEETALSLTSSQTITITNTGDVAFEVTNIQVPDGFSVSHTSLSVAVGVSVDVTVGFTPTEARVYTGGLLITSNDGEKTISLSGLGAVITSIEADQLRPEDISVYPNPTVNEVFVDLTELNGQPVDVKIVNQSGVGYLDLKGVTDRMLKLDLHEYAQGAYIMRIISGKHSISKRIMIRR